MQDQLLGNAPGADDVAVVVDVVQEGVQGLGTLLQALAQTLPLGLGHHARDKVEGNQAFGVATFGVDREGDADAAEQDLGLSALERQLFGRGGLQPGVDHCVGRPDLVGPAHFVERRRLRRHPDSFNE